MEQLSWIHMLMHRFKELLIQGPCVCNLLWNEFLDLLSYWHAAPLEVFVFDGDCDRTVFRNGVDQKFNYRILEYTTWKKRTKSKIEKFKSYLYISKLRNKNVTLLELNKNYQMWLGHPHFYVLVTSAKTSKKFLRPFFGWRIWQYPDKSCHFLTSSASVKN